VQVADGGNVAQGTTTDVAGAATVIGLLKGIYGSITGTLKTQAGIWFSQASNQSIGAGATFNGTARTNQASGVLGPSAYYQVVVNCPANGTLYINNGIYNQSFPISTGGTYAFKVPAFGVTFFPIFANGSTAGNITIMDGFTAA
jgi:hypothetical protein